mgnify:CR=1 FL=1
MRRTLRTMELIFGAALRLATLRQPGAPAVVVHPWCCEHTMASAPCDKGSNRAELLPHFPQLAQWLSPGDPAAFLANLPDYWWSFDNFRE